eukprot:GHVQ01021079.1.p1 GENE.GHVQ01021079.1~~GHVQ01021079.1.p1  ORF type:complete len:109 (-),score=9.49 GHVQ01021079.1:955-1281(-)
MLSQVRTSIVTPRLPLSLFVAPRGVLLRRRYEDARYHQLRTRTLRLLCFGGVSMDRKRFIHNLATNHPIIESKENVKTRQVPAHSINKRRQLSSTLPLISPKLVTGSC